ncbi:MAG: hypothetical protein ABI972_02965 [Acidobacteriota bacterium]
MKTLLALVCAALSCLAVETELWTHNAPADYENATLKNVVLRSDGRLTLAPAFTEVHDPSMPYLWAVAEDSKGRVYVAGGGPEAGGKIFEVTPDAPAASRAKVLATFTEFQVQALALDKQDRLYAATSPDGKVYRIVNGKAEVFYDPKAKYIWALAFNQAGDLFVATGDQGVIHRVTPAGQGSVFYQSGQTHVRSLAVDQKQNVIAGTEPSGYIISVNPAGQGFVIYQSPKREVTAVAVHPQGWIYAAAIGAKQMQQTGAPPPGPAPAPAPATGAANAAALRAVPPPAAIPSMSPSMSGGAEVYRIEGDGFTRKVWSHATDFVYSIAFDAQGNAILGTGNQGKLIRLDSDLLSSVLVNASPTQITALAPGKRGRIWATTGNIGKLYALGPRMEASGTVESEPLDAGFFSYWGRAHLTGAGLASAKLEVRSGNHDDPDKGWSEWATIPSPADGGRVPSPEARFLQYRLTLSAPAQGSTEVREIEIAHQEKNVAPVVEMVETTPVNYKFPAQTLTLTPSTTLSLPSMRSPKRNPPPLATGDSGAATMNLAKGFRGVRWLASDENGDALEAMLEIRGVNETSWKTLKDRTTERHFSWDGTAFADGQYVVRVTVSDAPDNTPQQTLKSSLVSDPFVIDNTPPAISALQASRSGARITASWKAADSLNPIARAEYSLNGGDWTVVEPTTRLSDSLAHDYSLTIDNAPAGEVTIAIRLADDFDNQAAANVLVR